MAMSSHDPKRIQWFLSVNLRFQAKAQFDLQMQQFQPLRRVASTSRMRTLQGEPAAFYCCENIVGLLQLGPETSAIEANTAFASLPQRQRGFSY